MKKTTIRVMALAVIFALILTLCGCDSIITTPENLLSPPALTGDMRPIYEALAKSITEGYTFVYPSAGEIRSPIAFEDIDGDGVKEAFAFYSTDNGEGTDMHINYIRKTKKGWQSLSDSVITAGGVEKILFCDISGDGKKEILVGWEVYGTTDKKLGIYSVLEDRLYERLMEEYTNFVCCDITGDKTDELVLQQLNTDEQSNIVSLYSLSQTGINRFAGCVLDGKVKSASQPIVSKLTNGKTALFIDEEKGNGSITEVLFMEGDELVNPLLDKEKGENLVTQRNTSIACTDIDADGAVEIPTSTEAPGADSAKEKFYYTNWCAFDGKTLSVKIISIMNQVDGYYLVLSSSLIDKIAISRNTETRTRTIYEYDRETAAVGRKMFSITALDTARYEKYIEDHLSAQIVFEDDQTVFVAEIFSAGAKLTMYDIKEMFNIMA